MDKPSIYKNINNYEMITKELDKIPIIESWTPRVYANVLVFVDTKTTGAKLIGINPEKEMSVTRFKEKIKKGSMFSTEPSKEVIIGAPLAKVLKAEIGSELIIITQAADGSIANGIFKIIGFAGRDDDPSERGSVYINIKTAQEFLELGNRIHEIAISIKDQEKSRKTALLIRDLNLDKTLEVSPWEEIEKDFYKAMQTDKKRSVIFFTIISLIVAVGILNTVLMTILERTREFGVLKALGTRPYHIFTVIVLETGILSIISAILGALAGMAINYYLSRHGIKYPTPIEFQGVLFTEMRCIINAESIIKPMILTILTAVIVSIYPAIRAARTIPVNALRSN
ncbi:MAG: ABC transporter permease [Nitrospirae bacterium]|nr:ABC transporter permease [Nitrospirota bacterium]